MSSTTSTSTIRFMLQLAANQEATITLGAAQPITVKHHVIMYNGLSQDENRTYTFAVDAYPVISLQPPNYMDKGSNAYALYSSLKQTEHALLAVLSTRDYSETCNTVKEVEYGVIDSQHQLVKKVKLLDFACRFEGI